MHPGGHIQVTQNDGHLQLRIRACLVEMQHCSYRARGERRFLVKGRNTPSQRGLRTGLWSKRRDCLG